MESVSLEANKLYEIAEFEEIQKQWDEAILEFDGGRVFNMAPVSKGHADVCSTLLALFRFVLSGKRYNVYGEPYGLSLSGNQKYQPDIQVIHADTPISDYYYEGIPALVAEVLSKTSVKRDRRDKFKAYLERGVPEYWIVSTDIRMIEVFILSGSVYERHEFLEGDIIDTGLFQDAGLGVDRIFGYTNIFEGLF
jgi:Uma2 family endonuclease